MKQVTVEWLDALTASGWHDLDDAAKQECARVETTGYMVFRDKDRVVIAQSLSGDQCLNYTVIPAPWVVRVRK